MAKFARRRSNNAMPFRFQISNVELSGSDVSLTGKLVSGAYPGPEAIVIHGIDGRSLTTPIISHSMAHPQGWPVLAAHATVLTLIIPAPPAGFEIDASRLVVGRGTVVESADRIDITPTIHDPLYWAAFLGHHLYRDEIEEPNLEFWGIENKLIDEYYTREFESRQAAGIWPYVRFQVKDAQYIEIESAAGVEYQDRFWIGDTGNGRRVLLGYHSGHFSLPAFRIEELLWFADVSHESNVATTPAMLMLLTACYINDQERFPVALITRLAEQLPGVKSGSGAAIATAFRNKLHVPGVRWTHDPDSGWVNNSTYSQRNRASVMSILTPEDFRFIRRFFEND